MPALDSFDSCHPPALGMHWGVRRKHWARALRAGTLLLGHNRGARFPLVYLLIKGFHAWKLMAHGTDWDLATCWDPRYSVFTPLSSEVFDIVLVAHDGPIDISSNDDMDM